MIFGMTAYQICILFIAYSFFGWITEVVYQAVAKGKVINRGFLNGPVCPVYGFGVLSVFAFINALASYGLNMNPLGVFLAGVVLATAIELFAGWILDICFHARWWDYTKKPFNFRGYICLEFSIIWGFAILFVVSIFHEQFENSFIYRIPHVIGWAILALFYAIYFVDFIVTVAFIKGLNKKLTQLSEIREEMRSVSDKLSEQIGTKTLETAQILSEGQVQAALAKAELKDAFEKKLEETKDANEDRLRELQHKLDTIEESFAEKRRLHKSMLLNTFENIRHSDHDDIVKHIHDIMRNKKADMLNKK